MEERTSVQFKNGNSISVVLYTKWDVLTTTYIVREYLRDLSKGSGSAWNKELALYKLVPQVVMADFIRFLTQTRERASNDLAVGDDLVGFENIKNCNLVFDLLKEVDLNSYRLRRFERIP